MREGNDVTLVAFGKMVGYLLQAADIMSKEGISCEVCCAALFGSSVPVLLFCASISCESVIICLNLWPVQIVVFSFLPKELWTFFSFLVDCPRQVVNHNLHL